jgi:hypothetical protein
MWGSLLDETEVGHYKAPAHIFHPVPLDFMWRFPDAKPTDIGLDMVHCCAASVPHS